MKPSILVVATSSWFPTARLVMALANAGCCVDAICPGGHPLCKTSVVRRAYTYRGLMPLRSIANAIAEARPVLVIPGDDLSAQHLHQLYARESRKGQAGAAICQLIERSCGAPENFSVVDRRGAFLDIAAKEGIRVPEVAVIEDIAALRGWIERAGYPVVLKADGTSGGYGVKIVRTLEEAARSFRTLHAPPLLARAAKRAVVDHDRTLIWPSLLRRRSGVTAHSFIDGKDVTSTVACWKGKVLAALHFEVIRKRYVSGPASVMRRLDNSEMTEAVEKMVRRLGLSGFHGFDFLLEASSSHAYLIEINPRTTQVGHLTLGPERDLPAALVASLTGSNIHPAVIATEPETIALFPQEWMRDPASPFLESAYHDVPWEEPELLRACLQRRPNQARAQRSKRVGFGLGRGSRSPSLKFKVSKHRPSPGSGQIDQDDGGVIV